MHGGPGPKFVIAVESISLKMQVFWCLSHSKYRCVGAPGPKFVIAVVSISLRCFGTYLTQNTHVLVPMSLKIQVCEFCRIDTPMAVIKSPDNMVMSASVVLLGNWAITNLH